MLVLPDLPALLARQVQPAQRVRLAQRVTLARRVRPEPLGRLVRRGQLARLD